MAMNPRSLLLQVLAVNALLVSATVLMTAVLADGRDSPSLIAGALVATLAGNALLLRRRFLPLDDLVSTMERVDLGKPEGRVPVRPGGSTEVSRLTAAFNRMLARLEVERRQAGMAAVRAQERERQRIAQDLHDEVNQALTAIKLRLSATMHDAPTALVPELREVKTLVDQAMDELLLIARALRPTALDDHGLISALQSQVTNFGERTGIQTHFHRHGELAQLSDEEQLVIYRVTQESLSNVAHHAKARHVHVDLSFTGNTVLKVADDGAGFDGLGAHKNGRLRGRPGGLGLNGMRERALLVGGNLNIFSRPGAGTTIELTMGGR